MKRAALSLTTWITLFTVWSLTWQRAENQASNSSIGWLIDQVDLWHWSRNMLSWSGHRPSVPGIIPVSSSSSPSAAPFPCKHETVSNFINKWRQPWFKVKLLFAAAATKLHLSFVSYIQRILLIGNGTRLKIWRLIDSELLGVTLHIGSHRVQYPLALLSSLG